MDALAAWLLVEATGDARDAWMEPDHRFQLLGRFAATSRGASSVLSVGLTKEKAEKEKVMKWAMRNAIDGLSPLLAECVAVEMDGYRGFVAFDFPVERFMGRALPAHHKELVRALHLVIGNLKLAADAPLHGKICVCNSTLQFAWEKVTRYRRCQLPGFNSPWPEAVHWVSRFGSQVRACRVPVEEAEPVGEV